MPDTKPRFIPCPGAFNKPSEIVREPQTHRDRWGNLCGYYGKGKCPSCNGEIGLNAKGEVTRHGCEAEQED